MVKCAFIAVISAEVDTSWRIPVPFLSVGDSMRNILEHKKFCPSGRNFLHLKTYLQYVPHRLMTGSTFYRQFLDSVSMVYGKDTTNDVYLLLRNGLPTCAVQIGSLISIRTKRFDPSYNRLIL